MSRAHRFSVGLTLLNLVLFILTLSSHVSTARSEQPATPILRGRALEIVDEQGRVRANIQVHGPETVNGVRYPETVLFRMTDPVGGPVVKLTAAANGAALGLSDGLPGNGGVHLYARDTASFVRVVDKSGRVQMLKP